MSFFAVVVVISAGVSTFTVSMAAAGVFSFSMSVVAAVYVRIVSKSPCKKCQNRFVRVSGNAAVQLDASLCQGILCASADSAADQSIHTVLPQKSCQSAVAAAVGVYDFRRSDLSIFDVIDLKLGSVSKVLKNLSIFISNCNFHCKIHSFLN